MELGRGFFKDADYIHFTKVITSKYMVTQMSYIPKDKQIKSLGNF